MMKMAKAMWVLAAAALWAQAGCGAAEAECEKGETRCNAAKTAAEICKADGTFMELEQCSGGAMCAVVGGEASCEGGDPNACVDGERRCSPDGASIQRCGSSGRFVGEQVCDAGDCAVVDGAPMCGAQAGCTPGTLRCSPLKNRVEECVGGEEYTTVEQCPQNSCVEADGQVKCDAMMMGDCSAGQTRCSPLGTRTEVCGPANTWIGGDRCGLGCEVVAGAAACKQPQQVCTPGVRSCSPLGGSIEECDAEGFGYRRVEDCPLNNCEVQGGQPVCPLICTAGELRCGPGRIEECEAGLRWRSKTSCGENVCVESGGAPACLVCTPGALRCGANNARTEVCNAAGTGYTQAEACMGNTCKIIDGVPDCELPCTPGATRCSALKNRVEVCDAAGTAFVADATCAGNTCIEAAGVAQCQPSPPECVEGQTRCSGIAVEQCGADGRYAATQTCQSSCQVREGEAECGMPECTPNQQLCGADNKIYYCNAQGRLSGVRQDCAATGKTCAALGGAPQCVAPAIAQSCTPNKQFCGAGDNTIYYCDGMGQVSGVREVCGAGQVCGVEGDAALCINGSYVTQPDGTMACVVSDPRTCGQVQKAGSTRGYVYAEVLKASCDANSMVVRECGDRMECVGGACTSSVADTSSPYYAFSCPLVQQLTLKTALEADCRCLSNNVTVSGVEVCGRPFERGTSGKRFGAGPSLVGLANGHYSGGFVEGDELIVAAYWGSSTAQRGMLLGIDVNTGDRRLISGDHNGTVRGAGPGFTYALDARKGPDNNYYVMTQSLLPSAPTIYRVNPTTGDRTVVWRGQDAAFGQCAAGDPGAQAQGVYLQYTNNGFAVDAQGAFYVGYANGARDGRGVVKISANGQTCSFLTATGTRADGLTRGTGPELGGFVQGFTLRNNKLVVQITQPKSMLEIDLATGNRAELITAQAAGIFGERWSVWDAARSVYWTAGLQGTVTIAAVDPARRLIMDIFSSCETTEFPWYPLCAGTGPIRINSQNYGGIWMHPTNGNLLVAQDSVSIVEFEVATGNSVIRSL